MIDQHYFALLKILLLVLAMHFCVIVNGQIITDRPNQTESSSTIPQGAFQIESGIQIAYAEQFLAPDSRQLLLPSNLFRIGMSERVELRLLNSLEINKSNDFKTEGLSDLQLGTKIQLLKNEQTNTEIAFLTHILIPIGSSSTTADEIGTLSKFSFGHVLSNKLSLGYNVGYSRVASVNDLNYSISLNYSLNSRVAFFIEPYGGYNDLNDWYQNWDAGFTCLLNDTLQLDFAYGTSFMERSSFMTVGLSWMLLKEQ